MNRLAEQLIALSVLDVERRREPRRPADGRVVLEFQLHGKTIRVEGRLIDSSAHGFRAAHACELLASGQEVMLRYPATDVIARVAWSALINGQRESGFVILRDER